MPNARPFCGFYLSFSQILYRFAGQFHIMQVNSAQVRRKILRERRDMTNKELKTRLVQVLQALNTIPVSGRVSLANLSGSIGVLEDIVQQLPDEEEKEE